MDLSALTSTQVALLIVTAVLGSSVISSMITSGVSWRLGVRGDERAARTEEAAARRDTIADRDDLISGLRQDVTELRGRVDTLEDKRRVDATLIRAQGDHIDTLEHHIWQGKPPPPPARPAGL